MVQPIGIAVVGGLTSSTFVTLLVIPVLYSIVMKKDDTVKSRIKIDYSILGKEKSGKNSENSQEKDDEK